MKQHAESGSHFYVAPLDEPQVAANAIGRPTRHLLRNGQIAETF
jgi:hypothetical protein